MKEQRREILKLPPLKLTDRLACPEYYRRGLTLVEILVGITLSTLLIGALYGVYIVSNKSYRTSVNQTELNQNARIALERISRDLRQSMLLVTTLPPTNTDTLNPAPSDITFQDGHDNTKIQYIRYYLSGTDLKRQVFHYAFSSNPTVWVTYDALDNLNLPPAKTITEDTIKANTITTLQFYGTSSLININLTSTNGTSNYKYETAVYARNI